MAAGNGATLTSCASADGASVRVTVSVPLQPAVHRLGWRDAVATARAGVVDGVASVGAGVGADPDG